MFVTTKTIIQPYLCALGSSLDQRVIVQTKYFGERGRLMVQTRYEVNVQIQWWVEGLK